MGRMNSVRAGLAAFPLLLGAVSAGALEEKSAALGGAAGWALVTEKRGVSERSGLRPYAVLALAAGGRAGGNAEAEGFWGAASDYAGAAGLTDMALSFDEAEPRRFADAAGNYAVSAGSGVLAVSGDWARQGAGAAFFSGSVAGPFTPGAAGDGAGLRIRPRADGKALLAEGRRLEDFSVEFWAYPLTLERGEQVFSWAAARIAPQTGAQNVSCAANRNRLAWDFGGFFCAPDGRTLPVSLSSKAAVLPKTWSHHLVRFNAGTGLVEYLVNGVVEDTAYATSSGKEGGEVFAPRAGARGSLTLGARFNGIIDEFFIKEGCSEPVRRPRYAPEGGAARVTARVADWESPIVRIDAAGGSAGPAGRGGAGRGDYARGGEFRFSGGAQIKFFMRAAATARALGEAEWTAFTPGEPLRAQRGCYVEVAADFYPSGDGERTPYLESLEIAYEPARAPPPPEYLAAEARDGAVELRWRGSRAPNVGGYLVYYGARPGEYLGEEAGAGPSPLDAGKNTAVRIDNLRNGRLYYFAVAAYDAPGSARAGEFSAEVSARPLKGTGGD